MNLSKITVKDPDPVGSKTFSRIWIKIDNPECEKKSKAFSEIPDPDWNSDLDWSKRLDLYPNKIIIYVQELWT